jgi:hypothetical protein
MILVYFSDDTEPHVYEDDDEARSAMAARKIAAAKVVHHFHPIRKPATASLLRELRMVKNYTHSHVAGSLNLKGSIHLGGPIEAFLAEWPDATHEEGESDA